VTAIAGCAPTSILVYTDGELIGDGLVRLPFAAALKQALPDMHLTWVASGYSVYDGVLREMARPFIDELVIVGDRRMYWRDFLHGTPVLRRRRFDLIIDTQRNAKRTVWLKRIAHHRFISAAADYLLCTPFLGWRKKGSHFFATLMELCALGIGYGLSAPSLAVPDGPWHAQATELLPPGPRYVGFAIGSSHPKKCWPLTHFLALAQHTVQRNAIPVFLLGPLETQLEPVIRAAVPQALFPLNSAVAGPSASPYLTMALAGRLTAAVANDSGGGHLLATGGAPLVSLFRLASVRTKFMPRGTRVIALAPEDFGGAMMRDIPFEAVQAALDELLPPAQ